MELVLYIIAVVFLVLAAFGINFWRLASGWTGLAIIAFTALLLPHIP